MKEWSEQRKIIGYALIRIGIKCEFSGFDYLVEAIEFSIENPQEVFNLKSLIANICKRCNENNASKIEASMQHAISATYNNRGFNSINDLFGLEIIRPDHKPTIGELVRLMSEYYLLKIYQQPTR